MMLTYKVVMVHDALAAYTDAEHNATLATFYMIFGEVQSIAEVTSSLRRGQAPGAGADAGKCAELEAGLRTLAGPPR
jgi:ureidoacrylate peracid hydrolase